MIELDKRSVELLAPVGTKESVKAAVSNGCDAIYLGGKAFSARQYADNFTIEELKEIIDYCHLRNVKVYITVNTLYKQKEMDDLFDFLNQLYQLGVDAFIVQDIGTAVEIKKVFPKISLHASTQMTIHNLEGVKFLESLRFDRVVLSRELSLEEISYITERTNLEIEVFVHGALCFSYSGQCLMSSMIGGRSGNRGRCAQPCRLPYRLMGENHREMMSGYLLSPKDIQTLDYIPQMIEAGIKSFKIEGRMKRPEYVGAVAGIYRKYIDLYFEKADDYLVDEQDIKILAQLFNRGGFSKGYLFSQGSKEMMSFENPKHWGIYAGKVKDYDVRTKKCVIDTTVDLKAGDGIEIWRKEKENTGVEISKASKAGEKISIYLNEPVKKGDLVYKTKDKELLEQIQKTYSKDIRKYNIYGNLRFKKHMPLLLQLWDDQGNFFELAGPVVEEAKNQPLTEERIKAQISKTGNTPFIFKSINIDCDQDAYLAISELNLIRRKAIEAFANIIIEKSRRDTSLNKRNLMVNIKESIMNPNKVFNVLLKNLEDIEYALHPKVKRIYMDLNHYTNADIEKAARLCHKHNKALFLALPRIDLNYKKEKIWYNLENSSIDGYLLRTYGQVYQLKNSNKEKILDYTFNIFNQLSVDYWLNHGMKALTLSPELNYDELKVFYGKGLEIIGYGYLPLMVTKQCVIGNTIGKRSSSCPCHCKGKKERYKLMDRKNEAFPIEQDCSSCLMMIYNSKPLLLLKDLDKILSLPISSLRLDFYLEEKNEIKDIIESYIDKPEIYFKKYKDKEYTKGHYFRGVE